MIKTADYLKMTAKMTKIAKIMFPFSILAYEFINTRVNPDVILHYKRQ